MKVKVNFKNTEDNSEWTMIFDTFAQADSYMAENGGATEDGGIIEVLDWDVA